jgi:hypothetical protein
LSKSTKSINRKGHKEGAKFAKKKNLLILQNYTPFRGQGALFFPYLNFSSYFYSIVFIDKSHPPKYGISIKPNKIVISISDPGYGTEKQGIKRKRY